MTKPKQNIPPVKIHTSVFMDKPFSKLLVDLSEYLTQSRKERKDKINNKNLICLFWICVFLAALRSLRDEFRSVNLPY